jgi:hypothetical protein
MRLPHGLPQAGASRPRSAPRDRRPGQSLVEFALILPIMLTLLLAGVDFGRAFLGWVELNNVVREAANFAAENPTAWNDANPNPAKTQYLALVTNDAAGINCTLPENDKLAPSFPDGQNIGQPATVRITCNFKLLTPFIGDIVGNTLNITASAAFPITSGAIAGIPAGVSHPTISTILSEQSGAIGNSVTDQAYLSGATATAGGTVIYAAYTNSACTSGGLLAGSVAVTNGVVPGSSPLRFTNAGTWYWQASYSGDANNTSATSTCADEILVIGQNNATIATTLSESSGVIGDTVHDSSALTGVTPTAGGTVTYTVYNDNACGSVFGSPSIKTVTNGVVPDSNAVTFNNLGTWHWEAVYSGDANNVGASSGCSSEPLTIAAASMCTVPDVSKSTTDQVQSIWNDAGFKTTVLFSPLSPPAGSNVKRQNPNKDTSALCNSATLTVTWTAPH